MKPSHVVFDSIHSGWGEGGRGSALHQKSVLLLVGTRVKNLHGIPWRIRTSISMEFHGNFSIDFHGKHQDTNFHGNFCIDIFHGGLGSTFSMEFHGKVPCNSIETTPSIIPWISREFHGIHRNQTFKISSESNGIHNRFWSTAIYLINKRTA